MQQKLSHFVTSSRCSRDVSPRALAVIQASRLSRRTGILACFGTNRLRSLHDIPAGSRSYFVVKKSRRFKFDEVRQRFRLTPTERRVAVFVAAAFVLGLITKCYRDAHPSPTPVQTHSGKSRASRSSSAKVDQPRAPNAGETARRTRKSAEKLNLPDSPTGTRASAKVTRRKLISPTSCLRKTLFPQIIAA